MIMLRNKMCNISVLDVSKFAADDRGTEFSCVGGGRYDQWGSCRNDRIKNYIVGAGGHRCPHDVNI